MYLPFISLAIFCCIQSFSFCTLSTINIKEHIFTFRTVRDVCLSVFLSFSLHCFLLFFYPFSSSLTPSLHPSLSLSLSLSHSLSSFLFSYHYFSSPDILLISFLMYRFLLLYVQESRCK